MRFWLDQGYFHADAAAAKAPFSITLPPPNVTGSLHMGHALGGTIQDVLIRWRRMQGANAMWMPGTDHAGIATQMLVERDLMRRVADVLERHPGDRRVSFVVQTNGAGPKLRVRAATARRIRPSDRFVREVEAVCGPGSVVLK